MAATDKAHQELLNKVKEQNLNQALAQARGLLPRRVLRACFAALRRTRPLRGKGSVTDCSTCHSSLTTLRRHLLASEPPACLQALHMLLQIGPDHPSEALRRVADIRGTPPGRVA